jgi:hypothetical protein
VIQSKQFWVKHPATINVIVQAYQCMQKRGNPTEKKQNQNEVVQTIATVTHIIRDLQQQLVW